MLKLTALRQADKTLHLNLLANRFNAGLQLEEKYKKEGRTFDETLIDVLMHHRSDILTGPPETLEVIALVIESMFSDFSRYLQGRSKNSKKNATHENTLRVITKYFDYEWFSRQKKAWGAYALVSSHRLRVCPYCHAHHVNYHVVAKTASNPAFRIRPPLDHYLPKSLYPYFAVSLSNLIPSCVQCNSGIKSNTDPLKAGLAHPLDPKLPLDVRFSAIGSSPLAVMKTIDDVKLQVSGSAGHSAAQVRAFRLQERYDWYRYEVKDLFDRYREYKQLPNALSALVSQDLFVLGFLKSQAAQRATGLCLRDVYKELVDGKIA